MLLRRRRALSVSLAVAAAVVATAANPSPAPAEHGGAPVVEYCNSGIRLGFPPGWCGYFARHSWNANVINYSGGPPTPWYICAGVNYSLPIDGNDFYGSCSLNGFVGWLGNQQEDFVYLAGYNGDSSWHTFYANGLN